MAPPTSLRIPLLLCLAALLGCGDDASPTDAGQPQDAATPTDSAIASDAGTADASGPSPVEDAGPPSEDAGTPAASTCDDVTLPARSGATLRIAPAGDGQVTLDGSTMSLRQAVNRASEGDTLLFEDGTYTFPEASGGSYTGVYITTPNITLRSASGNPEAVVIDSRYLDHGNSSAPITIAAAGVAIADLTVTSSIFHLVHLWEAGDDALLHNLRLIDGGQQFVKASPGRGNVDGVTVSCSHFEMTPEGRRNVWGYGAPDGYTRCYTGGIDTHDSRNWWVHHNHFEGIYCDTETPHPAHGRLGELRDNRTYTGGLSEHAIHMWDSEEGSAHIIEGNTIVDCARGIGIGLRDDVYGTIVRNNMIVSSHAGSSEHDIAINVDRGHGIHIENNSVFLSHPDGYSSAIEYRFASSDLVIRNNLTNRRLRARDGADANTDTNLTEATADLFTDVPSANLRLASCPGTIRGQGTTTPNVTDDIDAQPRMGRNDIGADQCAD